ncbi:hypothetical protein CCZ01_00620 [Helicobacter monodelphidis]|uniref:COG3400 family protein n=1 Tax=Helicobacter sp. 15-1451 TaxID=2004995 RepID=UPI000DCB37D2|nr:TrkA C-terminal domain-containing protein [Helicobacter sp. 15-1451]RAX59275.1 hypothetical protein CCZ01_00620 [Helicobacter sp. 15-1451]
MRKILLIVDGVVAQDFLKNLLKRGVLHNSYIVVSKEEWVGNFLCIEDELVFHHFDPTSASKLNSLLSREVLDAFIVMSDQAEAKAVYYILRQYSQRIAITFLGGELDVEDKNLNIITESSLIATHLIERVPNIPIIAKDIGLGGGEIMEVSVPFGSSFAYRSIGSIRQKNYKIVALYRDGRMMFAKYSIIIEPNDALLLVGDPGVLLEVYKSIKEELGQFPFPFGRNLILYCDCLKDSNVLFHSIEESLYLLKHSKAKKLYIQVLNPTYPELLHSLRKKVEEESHVEITIKYRRQPFVEILKEDYERLGGGLVLFRDHFFMQRHVRKVLLNLNIPLLRLGCGRLQDFVSSAVLISPKIRESEKISSVAFDISNQLKYSLILYDFAPDDHYHTEVTEHYESMAQIFDVGLEVKTTSMDNPIVWLIENPNILGIFPFTEEMTKRRLGPFSTNLGKLSLDFIATHKLFIPIGK